MSAEAESIQQSAVPSAVDNVTAAVAKFDRVAFGLAELKAKYAGIVFDVSTAKGMKEAATARAAIRGPRVEVEKVRKECKAPILALGKEIDARAAAITLELLALEDPVDQQITAEQDRREQEKAHKAEVERARIAGIHRDIESDLRGVPTAMLGRTAEQLSFAIHDVVAIEITAERFAEFVDTATAGKESALVRLREMHAKQLAHEADQERLRLEREELARQRAEEEQANIEARRRIALDEAEAKRKRDAEEADALAKRQAEEADRQRQIEESMAKLRAEREQRDRENVERAERQRIEDEQRAAEYRRQQDELQRQQAIGEARWGEINAMGHQVMIAITGRVGVRVGGTRDCIIDTLAETGTWAVTEEKFGPLYGVAISARKTACDAINRELQAWDARVESQRIEAEQTAAVPAEPVAPPAEATEPEVAAILSSSTETPAAFAPSANDIAQIVSTAYGVQFDQAMAWCVNAFSSHTE